MNKRNRFSRALAVIASLTLATLPLVASGPASATNSESFNFVSCMADKKVGSVLVLMDESGTIYKNDPSQMRVTGTQLLVDDLQRVSDKVPGSEIKVQLAGFGDNFVPRSSGNDGWVSIKHGETGGADELKKTAKLAFTSEPADKNHIETDSLSSLFGAQKALQEASGCNLLVFFKDGEDWQYFNKGGKSPVEFPTVQTLLDAKKFKEAENEAKNQLCRPLGVVDGIRNTGVFTLAVAFKGTSQDLNAFVTSKSCGSLEPRGLIVEATDPAELPSLFASALDPSFRPNSKSGSFSFMMSEALQSISVLTSNNGPFDNYTVTPPTGCQVDSKITFDSDLAAKTGSFGPGVDWTSYKYGENTVRIVIKHNNRANKDCWNGTWTIDPSSLSARSSLELDSNLQVVTRFTDDKPFITPGNSVPTEYELNLQTLDNGEPLSNAELDPSVALTINGYLINESGEESSIVFANKSRTDLEKPLSLTVPDSVPVGQYKFQVRMNMEIPGIDSALLKQSVWERDIEIRGELRAPQFIGQAANFGDINGLEPASTEIRVKNLESQDLVLDLKKSKVDLAQAPEGLQYVFANTDSVVRIPANQEATIKVAIRIDSENGVRASGNVSGQLRLNAFVDDNSKAKRVNFDVMFHAVQKAEANAVVFTGVSFIVLAFMGLITLAAIWLVNRASARFPIPMQTAGYASGAFDASLTENGVTFTEVVSESNDKWSLISVAPNRTQVSASNYSLKANHPGLRLAGESYATLTGSTGFGRLNNLHNLTPADEPRVTLALNNSVAVILPSEQLFAVAAGAQEQAFCQVLVITNDISQGHVESLLEPLNQNFVSAREELAKKHDPAKPAFDPAEPMGQQPVFASQNLGLFGDDGFLGANPSVPSSTDPEKQTKRFGSGFLKRQEKAKNQPSNNSSASNVTPLQSSNNDSLF